MKSKLTNFLLAGAFIFAASSTFVSCKDYESDDIQQVKYDVSNLDANMQNEVNALNKRIDSLKNALDAFKSTSCDAQHCADMFATLQSRIDSLANVSKNHLTSNDLTDILNRLTALEGKSDDTSWKQEIQDLKDQVTDLKDQLANIKPTTPYDDTELRNKITDLTNQIISLTTQMGSKASTAQITDLQNQIDALKSQLNPYDDTEVRNLITNLTTKLGELAAKVDDKATKKDLQDVSDRVKALEANDKKQDDAIAELKDKIGKLSATDTGLQAAIDLINNTTIPELKSDFETKVSAANAAAAEAKSLAQQAQTKADQASADAAAAKTAADAAAEKAQNLYDQAKNAIDATNLTVSNLENATVDMVAALLTQVIIQSTYSPAVGEFALPLDVQANTLITYYGNNSEAFEFPTRNSSYFYNASEAENIPAAAISGKQVTIPAGTIIDGDGAEGNAGKLYVTINPNTVDATGVQFALVNSQGTKSPVQVGKATSSDRELTWGYTRATGNNFYEIPATITKDELSNCTFNVERTGLRNAVKNLIKNRTQTKSSIKALAKELAQFVYENMNGVAPRLALSTSYKVGTKESNKRSLNNVTEMSIMAGAFKPLGFGAFNDVHMETVPGLERVEKLISNFINSIQINNVKIEGISNKTIDHVESIGQISKAADGTYVITVTVKATDGSEATGTVDITDQINNLIGTINTETVSNMDDAVAKFNEAIDAYNDIITEINGGVSVDLSSQKASYISKIDSYLDKVNGRFTYWFNRVVGASLDPCMLFFGADGNVHRLISGNAGVRVKGSSIRLVPTTYTYELLAPAYKKFVTVTNANVSGTNLGKVISGDTRDVTITGLKSGHTYNVLYEAVDYNGKVSARQYKIVVE